MENEILKSVSRISDIVIDTHFEFKLDGWPASVFLITLCLSGVMVYGIKIWSETKLINTTTVAS